MNFRRLFLRLLGGLAALILVVTVLAGALWIYFHPTVAGVRRVPYGQRHGQELAYDVVRPEHPNGLGVALMVSGSWKSGTNSFRPWMTAPLLRRGYTILAVYHVSQPTATVAEIFDDVRRAIRHIRHHALEHGIDPSRLGVTGGSAGGHLSLLVATRGTAGPAEAPDPVDRESCAVQAVAIFYPVTDLLNLGDSTENLRDGGPPKSFVKAFRPQPGGPTNWTEIGRSLSPIFHVHPRTPPTLIYHGDADTLVPLDQSQRYQAKAREVGPEVELVVHPGGRHGWLTMLWDIRHFAEWFDRHLRPPGADLRASPPREGSQNSVLGTLRRAGLDDIPAWPTPRPPTSPEASPG
jgi:acetyl esterase/lipase